MDQQERLNALDVAITNEMRERKFYLQCAERTRNPLGRAMFQQIADDELEHYRRLKELQEKRSFDEGLPDTVPLKVRDTNLKNILKDVIDNMDKLSQVDDDELEAVRTAIDFEAKGAAYYAKLRDEVTDPKEKAFFDLLANMEHQHYLILKETEAYFTNPDAWFAER
jgi:rubrerythrin